MAQIDERKGQELAAHEVDFLHVEVHEQGAKLINPGEPADLQRAYDGAGAVPVPYSFGSPPP